MLALLAVWLLMLICRLALIRPPAHANAAVTASSVVVTNDDHFAWPGVTLYVNGAPRKNAYQFCWKKPVAAGQSITIDLDELALSGKRFDPSRDKVQFVYLSVPGRELLRFPVGHPSAGLQ